MALHSGYLEASSFCHMHSESELASLASRMESRELASGFC